MKSVIFVKLPLPDCRMIWQKKNTFELCRDALFGGSEKRNGEYIFLLAFPDFKS
jgi:hypothetical protein